MRMVRSRDHTLLSSTHVVALSSVELLKCGIGVTNKTLISNYF